MFRLQQPLDIYVFFYTAYKKEQREKKSTAEARKLARAEAEGPTSGEAGGEGDEEAHVIEEEGEEAVVNEVHVLDTDDNDEVVVEQLA